MYWLLVIEKAQKQVATRPPHQHWSPHSPPPPIALISASHLTSLLIAKSWPWQITLLALASIAHDTAMIHAFASPHYPPDLSPACVGVWCSICEPRGCVTRRCEPVRKDLKMRGAMVCSVWRGRWVWVFFRLADQRPATLLHFLWPRTLGEYSACYR